MSKQSNLKGIYKALEKLEFKSQIPGKEYGHMNLNQIFQKERWKHPDGFHCIFCQKYS